MGSMSMMKTLSILYLFALLMLCVNGARISTQNAHSSAATPAKETCDTLVGNVMPCLNFFLVGSKDKEPGPTCCPNLKHVLSVNASCLCIGLEAAPSLGFKINFTRAMELPGVCGVKKLPPGGQCNFPTAPLPSPSAPLPSPSAPSAPVPSPAAPTPAKESCTDIIADVGSCIDFLLVGSNDTEPVPLCCTRFKRAISINASCLCIGLAAAPSMGFYVNYTRATDLPGICGVKKLPPGGQCNFPTTPLPSPSAPLPSPANPPPSTPPATPPVTPSTPTPPTLEPSTPTPATPAPSTPSTPIVPTMPPMPMPMPPTSNSSATAPSSSKTSNSSRRISNGPLFLVSAIMVLVSFLSVV